MTSCAVTAVYLLYATVLELDEEVLMEYIREFPNNSRTCIRIYDK
jgi:hypothetical protein